MILFLHIEMEIALTVTISIKIITLKIVKFWLNLKSLSNSQEKTRIAVLRANCILKENIEINRVKMGSTKAKLTKPTLNPNSIFIAEISLSIEFLCI